MKTKISGLSDKMLSRALGGAPTICYPPDDCDYYPGETTCMNGRLFIKVCSSHTGCNGACLPSTYSCSWTSQGAYC
ncbi:hypothetical protein [Catenulispora subtropica]|uniref:Uncharacterized protein n=1 Tax=Catenulispora subtropica TaxID=450798 RepID=A0ABN2TC72_9ACTN